jgi:diketogulonate reductase-like aldo/keto reductase
MNYYGVVPEAWAPLGGGRYSPWNDEMLKGIAEAHGKTIGQVILRWNVQRGVVVIPKSVHKERIEENFNIWDFTLTEEEMAKISALDMGYAGTAIKHFDPDFVRMCTGRKIHD